jgi:hypothetical protein
MYLRTTVLTRDSTGWKQNVRFIPVVNIQIFFSPHRIKTRLLELHWRRLHIRCIWLHNCQYCQITKCISSLWPYVYPLFWYCNVAKRVLRLYSKGQVLFLPRFSSPSEPRLPHYLGFVITLRHTTFGSTPLDEWSVRLRDLYLTTQNT